MNNTNSIYKINTSILILLILAFYTPAKGQINDYTYQRELLKIENQWHSIELPDDIYGKISNNMTDIRIYGITQSKDTIEAPYVLQVNAPKTTNTEIPFETINKSHNHKGYYYTFKNKQQRKVNELTLDFDDKNFDWKIQLEGSMNQNEWFSILNNYRIVSIKNEQTDYQFTKLIFPASQYTYLRLLIPSDKNPNLNHASLKQLTTSNGHLNTYIVEEMAIREMKKHKQTEVIVSLNTPVPVSKIIIHVSDTIDYYRPVTLKYLSDSIKTEKGWKYNYVSLRTGTLSSLEKNEFNIQSTVLKRLKIIIYNHDNQPLHVSSIELNGYQHLLKARFSQPANYYLCYSNNKAPKPIYDIHKFSDKIPEKLYKLELGKEKKIIKVQAKPPTPLINKVWLWVIMLVVIAILAWFSVKMLKSSK